MERIASRFALIEKTGKATKQVESLQCLSSAHTENLSKFSHAKIDMTSVYSSCASTAPQTNWKRYSTCAVPQCCLPHTLYLRSHGVHLYGERPYHGEVDALPPWDVLIYSDRKNILKHIYHPPCRDTRACAWKKGVIHTIFLCYLTKKGRGGRRMERKPCLVSNVEFSQSQHIAMSHDIVRVLFTTFPFHFRTVIYTLLCA